MKEYICYTKQSHWTFYADNDIDAVRMATYLCWRDGEDFERVELGKILQLIHSPHLPD